MRIISYTQHFFNFFVQKIRSVNTDRILIQLSAYTADYRTGDECQKCAGAVDIFAQGVEPFADWLACAEVDAVKHRLFARHPEEHDSSKQCAEGADVNRHNIHPLRDYRLYAQCNGKTDDMDYGCCGYALELKLFPQQP